MRSGSQLDDAERTNAAVDLAMDLSGFYLDVGAHDAMLTDLEPLAVENVAVELAFDPQRARDHQRASKIRTNAQHRIGWSRSVLVLTRSEPHHWAPFLVNETR